MNEAPIDQLLAGLLAFGFMLTIASLIASLAIFSHNVLNYLVVFWQYISARRNDIQTGDAVRLKPLTDEFPEGITTVAHARRYLELSGFVVRVITDSTYVIVPQLGVARRLSSAGLQKFAQDLYANAIARRQGRILLDWEE